MSLVCPKVAALAEHLATDIATVWLLTSVDAQMQLQAVGVVELLVAGAASKWSLPRVRASM